MADATTDLTPGEGQNFDAMQATEEIAGGEQKAPKVDVDADYEASKEYSVSDVDRSGQGADAAAAATAPEHELHAAEETKFEAEPTGDPGDFREMAQDLRPEAANTGDSHDLMQKAIEKGQPGQ
ncbi:MAG TPA: hypothetical protein V6D16_02670 [Candidatus Obscuribacterales bacterium]